jgi:hypothetical protein
MRKGWSVVATAFMASMVLMSLGLSVVSACTFANGHESFEYDISPQEYAAREGAMKAGEQASFVINGGTVDVFVFNPDQYFSYVNLGKDQAGWKGSAAYQALGVSSTEFIFTAPSEGNYFLVIDNTVAGSDPGESQKSVSMDILSPLATENEPSPFIPIMLIGFVSFVLIALVAFARK